MNEITKALNDLFSAIVSGSRSYLLALVGLGTLTMAVLQTIKDTTPLRRWFQRMEMRHWLQEQAGIACKNLKASVDSNEAERQLILLATDGSEGAFYDLEIEKLCGQWNAANQIIIDYPELYPDLAASVAAWVSKVDYDKVLKGENLEALPPNAEAKLSIEHQRQRAAARQEFLDARNRVLHQIQRSVDSFQISTSFRWKWHLQIASFVVSFLFALFAMVIVGRFNLAVALLSAAVAGFLAPVSRDLLAAVRKLRD